MWRTGLLLFGWLTAALAFYGTLVGFELHWNLFDWSPKFDLTTAGLSCVIVLDLAAAWWLAQNIQNRLTLIVSLVLCLALAALAVYVFPAEAKSQGLFGRLQPSPTWYRAFRLGVLFCPIAFWFRACLRRRPGA